MSQDLPVEEIIKIIQEQKGLSREEIINLIQAKIQKLGGFLTEKGAAHIVARELQVDLSKSTHFEPIKIKDLTPTMNNVSLKTRIVKISTPKIFERKDGTEGALQRLIVQDNTGQIPVILWDHSIKYVEQLKLQPGDIIKITGAYTRPGRNEDIEIHIGNRGQIEKLEDDNEIEKITTTITTISEIQKNPEKQNEVSVKGKIITIYPSSEFQRKNGSLGKVTSIIFSDQTGTTRIVFWNEQTQLLENIINGQCILIQNLRPKTKEDGTVELHTTQFTQLTIIDEKECENIEINAPQPKEQKISQLTPGEKNVSITGIVIGKEEIKEYTRPDGTQSKRLTLFLKDETGVVRCTFWDKNAENAEKIEPGQKIKITNAMVREGYLTEEPEISVGTYGQIQIINEETQTTPEIITKIEQIKDGQKNIVIQAKVLKKDELRELTTQKNEETKLQAIIVSDKTAQARIIAWEENAEKLAQVQEQLAYEFGNLRARQSAQGIELVFGKSSYIKPLPIEDFDDIIVTADTLLQMKPTTTQTREIITLQPDEYVTITGTIVKIFDPVIYNACPECNKKLSPDNICETHGLIEKPQTRLIISLVIDDSTETIHTTFFGEQAQKLLQMDPEQIKETIETLGIEEIQTMIKEKLLLRDIKVGGKTRKKEEIGRIELNASWFELINPKKETKKIINKLGKPPE